MPVSFAAPRLQRVLDISLLRKMGLFVRALTIEGLMTLWLRSNTPYH